MEELRTIDPNVTGQPVVAYESMRLVESACKEGLAYAFVLVAGIAALMIRRWRETALALVPLLLGTLWTIALMQAFGLRFNLVNVWALPLIVGSAAEYGLNIVLRDLESRTYGGPRLARSTVMGVVFNGLTTIAGFGAMLVADHRGVWSLGLILAIGTTMALAASLVVLPTLMHVAHKRLAAVGGLAEEWTKVQRPRSNRSAQPPHLDSVWDEALTTARFPLARRDRAHLLLHRYQRRR